MTVALTMLLGGLATLVIDHDGRAGAPSSLIRAADHPDDPLAAIVAVRTNRPFVALSFDDGPDPRFTPQILRLLAANRAHATFFVIGTRVARHRALARATVAAGNELGDHTRDHLLLPRLGAVALGDQISGGIAAIRAAGLPAPGLLRPPHGFFDRRVSAAVARAGLQLIGWDAVVERELRRTGSAAAAAAKLARSVHPGSIILAHDGRLHRGATVATIARLLPALRARGLQVVTVSRLLRAAGR